MSSRPASLCFRSGGTCSELEVDEDRRNVWFLFSGDEEALAALLPQLIRAGSSVSHFGVERRSPAAALSRLFHEESPR